LIPTASKAFKTVHDVASFTDVLLPSHAGT